MSQVKRSYVEKKPAYAIAAKELTQEIKDYLAIEDVTSVRELIRYDVENVSEKTLNKAKGTVFSEPPVDEIYEGDFPRMEGDRVFSVEYLPGQFDQRADSAEQCVQLLNESENPVIRSATTYVLSGNISETDFERIKAYCINPVDSRETDETLPQTLIVEYDEPDDVRIFANFIGLEEEELKRLYDSLGLAMTFKDFVHIKKYFRKDEGRDPSMTEIRVLDTYWSDHCRHTTFATELKEIHFGEGYYKPVIEKTFRDYLKDRIDVYGYNRNKYVCLMDIALMGMKKLKADGILDNMEESDEINACSIAVPVQYTDGSGEEWLISFKNETHNHPTEIEPFGGAATCLGGRTGRDGCGGATGSSKAHTTQSIDTCGAEVQKGNPPTERKIQRLFRREEVSRLIKKCNDFGAGGVSVAIGELADGLRIDLDKVPKKYAGLDGTELAISESQERMAVVLDPKDVDQFLAYSAEENLEAIPVAEVTE